MNLITKTGCIFYTVATVAIAIQQIFYGDSCPIFFPPWPNPISGYSVFAYLFSFLLIISCVSIINGKHVRFHALLPGGLLLLMLVFVQVPWEYFVFPHKKTHLSVWGLPLKGLASPGGAFCIAGAYNRKDNQNQSKFPIIVFLAKLIPFGPAFFSTTIILFGVCHLLYTPGIADIVPSWIPGHYFWAYFSAAALMSAGVSIIVGVWAKKASMLLGIMILIWCLLLHIPNPIKNPLLNKGNLVFSALSALAFSGIAFIISGQIIDKKYTFKNEKNFQY